VEPPALTHIEQPGDVWRSPPFFVATLALQPAAIFQVTARLPPPGTRAGQVALARPAATGAPECMALRPSHSVHRALNEIPARPFTRARPIIILHL